jgi:hypothetical protein
MVLDCCIYMIYEATDTGDSIAFCFVCVFSLCLFFLEIQLSMTIKGAIRNSELVVSFVFKV